MAIRAIEVTPAFAKLANYSRMSFAWMDVLKADMLGDPDDLGSVDVSITFQNPKSGKMFVDCFPMRFSEIVDSYTKEIKDMGAVISGAIQTVVSDPVRDPRFSNALGVYGAGIGQAWQDRQNQQAAQGYRDLTGQIVSSIDYGIGGPWVGEVTVSGNQLSQPSGGLGLYQTYIQTTMAASPGFYDQEAMIRLLQAEIARLTSERGETAKEECIPAVAKEERALRLIEV